MKDWEYRFFYFVYIIWFIIIFLIHIAWIKIRGAKVRESSKQLWQMIKDNAFWTAHNTRFAGRHLNLAVKGRTLFIVNLKHEDYVSLIDKDMRSLAKRLPLDEYIRKCLGYAIDGCTFIIFENKNQKNQFIQFWTKEGKLCFNLTATKQGNLRKYVPKIAKILKELGLKRGDAFKYGEYEISRKGKTVFLDAFLNKDVDKASKLSCEIFERLYKTKQVRAIPS